MPALTDPVVRAKIHHALSNWRFTGYVVWRQVAEEWVRRELDYHTTTRIGELMFEHVRAGGRIDQVEETRPEHSSFRYHYDFRLSVEGRLVYLETVLDDDDPDDPTITVVNAHEA